MNANTLTNKEIQYNIMIALMQISGSLSDLVTQKEKCEYDIVGGEVDEHSGISQ